MKDIFQSYFPGKCITSLSTVSMMSIFRLEFQRRGFNQSVMVKRMTNNYKKKKRGMWLILISDGYLCQHCRKGFNFQQTWWLQTHATLQPFSSYRQSYLIPSLVFKVCKKLLLFYFRFMEPTSRAETPGEGICIFFHSSQTVFNNCQLIVKHFLCESLEWNKWLQRGRIWARKAAHEGIPLLTKVR